MDEKDLKQMVLQIIGEMTGGDASAVGETLKAAPNRTVPEAARASAARDADTGEAISDITKIDLRRLYLVEHPKDKEGFLEYKLKTPARLGVGRAGAGIKPSPSFGCGPTTPPPRTRCSPTFPRILWPSRAMWRCRPCVRTRTNI